MQPKVTVITTTYNLIKAGRESTFRQCVESVHRQTYKNIEHIIIDGASDDGTLDLIKEYADQNWLTCYSEPDSGIYDAMNKGILKAKGKYVVCLNSDDFYNDEHAVEWLVEKAEKEHADACYANTKKIDPETSKEIQDWRGEENFLPWKTQFPCHQTFLIRTDVMKELGLYDLQYTACADNAFLLKMVQNNKLFCNIDKYIVCFRDGGFTNDHQSTVLQDKINLLYGEYGRYHGLTKEDCAHLIWNKFLTLPTAEAVKLGIKLENQKWREQYFDILLPYLAGIQTAEGKTAVKLFGFIPVFECRQKKDKKVWKVFGIPFLKCHRISGGLTRKYSLLGLPIMKIGQK